MHGARRVRREEYTIKDCKASSRVHLQGMGPSKFKGFDGRRAFAEAEKEMRRRQDARRAERLRLKI
jgi:hypothetical protein